MLVSRLDQDALMYDQMADYSVTGTKTPSIPEALKVGLD